jgi:peptidoglycan/LPS O-acetylase OafA/YrhL
MKNRIYFLDNLRTFLIFLVVLYHSSIVFQAGFEESWIVSDPMKSKSIGLIGLYVNLFVMFTLFFISGYFIPASLKNKSTWSFIKVKFKKIIIPWVIAVFTLIPAYKIIFLYSRGLPQEEWYSYFHFFQRTGEDLNFWSNAPTQQWLWFLPVLFLFQILYLLLAKVKLFSITISLKTAIVLTFFIGLIYSLFFSYLDLKGWYYSALIDFEKERLLIYFMVFLLGSLCFKLKVFDTNIRNKKHLIIINIILTLGITIFTIVAMNLFFNIVYPDRNYFIISREVDILSYYASLLLSMLSFLYILLDLFKLKFDKVNKFWNFFNKNSYQVYIIHMIIIGLIALLLMNIPVAIFIKFPVLVITSFILSNLIVHLYKRFLM